MKKGLPAGKPSSVRVSDCISKPHVFNEDVRFFCIIEALVIFENTRGRVYNMAERVIMDEAAIQRTVTRIAHEILEYNKGTDNLILLGIKTRGAFLANRIQQKINSIENIQVPTGTIGITQFRDDLEQVSTTMTEKSYEIDVDITNKVVIIIDDVLYTGRTVRASLDAVLKHARPKKIGLATLVDRGHRELPIRADFVGKNIPTARHEDVEVFVDEIDEQNAVIIK